MDLRKSLKKLNPNFYFYLSESVFKNPLTLTQTTLKEKRDYINRDESRVSGRLVGLGWQTGKHRTTIK